MLHDHDYTWAWQDGAYAGPDVSCPVVPLKPVDLDNLIDLKNFMMSAGTYGILPTRALSVQYSLQRKSPAINIPEDGKQTVSLSLSTCIPSSDTITITPDTSVLPSIKQETTYEIPF